MGGDSIMISSAVYSFLGGTAFRLFLTFVMDRIKDWQEFSFEVSRTKLQNELENDQARRHIEILKAQQDANVKTVQVQNHDNTDLLDLTSFQTAVQNVNKPSGFAEIDAWNSLIRPALATICMLVWVISLVKRDWMLTPWDLELIAAVLGIFVGSRISQTGK